MKNKAFFLEKIILDPLDLKISNIDVPRLKPKEILIRNTYIGVNILDIYIAEGKFPDINIPNILGIESVGIIEEIGLTVPHELSIGDKVINVFSKTGAFAEYRICNYSDIFVIKNDVSAENVIAFLYKSMMAKALMYNASFIFENMNILITDPISDLGCILTQFVKEKLRKSGVIIGCTDTEDDTIIAIQNGCNFVINTNISIEEHADCIKKYTDNIGVNIVYDARKDIFFDKGVASLIPFGCYTYYGDPTNFGLQKQLNFNEFARKSLFLSMPNFFTAINKDYSLMVFGLLDIIHKFEKKIIDCNIIDKYSFDDIPMALKDLKDGNVKNGSIVVKV